MEGATTGIHDHDEWSREQDELSRQELVARIKQLNGFVRKYAHRIRLADNDDDPTGDPPPLLDAVHQVHQTRGRLLQRLEVLNGVYRATRARLTTALEGYEERRKQRMQEMGMYARQAPQGQQDFDSDDEAFAEPMDEDDEDEEEEGYGQYMRRLDQEQDDGF